MSQRDPYKIEPYEEEAFPYEYRAPPGAGFIVAVGSGIGIAGLIYMLARVIFG